MMSNQSILLFKIFVQKFKEQEVEVKWQLI